MSSSNSSKKIVLSKNKFSNSQLSSSSSQTPQFPPLPISPTPNRFAPLVPKPIVPRPPFSSIVKPLEAKSIIQASTSKPIVQASTSTHSTSNALPYSINPDTKIIKILEPIEVEKVQQSFFYLD